MSVPGTAAYWLEFAVVEIGWENEHPRADAIADYNALVAKIVEQADRIAWLEGEVAGWRIKLAECEERHEPVESG